MTREIMQAVRFTLVSMTLLGGGYHLLLWTIGRIAFPAQAEGSLLRRADGTIIGSRLIAQKFARPEYVHPRPSGVDYNAAATGGTNYGPSNLVHLSSVRDSLIAFTARNGVSPHHVPSEMVTASGSGLDPHIPPEAAALQASRIAASRRVSVDAVRTVIAEHIEQPTLGLLGRTRVNVLELNLALDESFGAPALSTARPADTNSR